MIPNAMPPFDFGLGETADALRDQVQRFASAEVAPIAAEIDKTDRFPRELWPRTGCMGSPSRRSMADRASATSSTWWRWKSSAAPRPPWV